MLTRSEIELQIAKVTDLTSQLSAESAVIMNTLSEALDEIDRLNAEVARLQAELQAAQDSVAVERSKTITDAQAALEAMRGDG